MDEARGTLKFVEGKLVAKVSDFAALEAAKAEVEEKLQESKDDYNDLLNSPARP